MPLTPEQETLRQAAMAATPGPWDFDTADTPFRIAGGEVVGGDPLPYGDVYTAQEWETPEGSEVLVVAQEIGVANGRFIAAANPSAILALLAQLEATITPQAESALQSLADQGQAVESPTALDKIDKQVVVLWGPLPYTKPREST